ncbi:MAG: formylglycine-generating enzyme family protein [Bacteroides sp.]|nr:formylglycine-generating enzyme family protein [Bacteroides sp.]MCM1086095.1 formylglycine-generating enzyme family protein [Bacteroides sp.]
MKRLSLILPVAWAMLLLAACGNANGANPPKGMDFIEKSVPGLNLEMKYVEGGSFQMGATAEQLKDLKEGEAVQGHACKVTLSSYYIGKFEVTQEQWKIVMNGIIPLDFPTLSEIFSLEFSAEIEEKYAERTMARALWKFDGGRRPITYVSWEDAQSFCKRLSSLTGKTYRLPTEAEWEYAARGGNKSKGYKYSGSDMLDEVAWREGGEQIVGTKKGNELGIFDMSGNVAEWCLDWSDSYVDGVENPRGMDESYIGHMARGGSNCGLDRRVSGRLPYENGGEYIGFRVVLEL